MCDPVSNEYNYLSYHNYESHERFEQLQNEKHGSQLLLTYMRNDNVWFWQNSFKKKSVTPLNSKSTVVNLTHVFSNQNKS